MISAAADAAVAIAQSGDRGVQFFAKDDRSKPLRPEVAINLAAVNHRLLALALSRFTGF